MNKVLALTAHLIACMAILLLPLHARAEWKINYECSSEAQIEDNNRVVYGKSMWVPKGTAAGLDTSQTVQCTLVWQGDDTPPSFIEITEDAVASGGGQN